jgi:rubredoxin
MRPCGFCGFGERFERPPQESGVRASTPWGPVKEIQREGV